LADVVELLLDKGIVINADIAVSVGDAELLGIQLRAAIASFETAAKYGLEFPTGTDTDRIEEIAEGTSIEDEDDREIDRSEVGERVMGLHEPPISDSSPAMSGAPITESGEESEEADEDGDEDDGGLSEAIEGAGDAISGSEDTRGGSEPGIRERPTAPDATGETDAEETDADADTDTDAKSSDEDESDDGTERDAANGNTDASGDAATDADATGDDDTTGENET
jgi:hypothetical protein